MKSDVEKPVERGRREIDPREREVHCLGYSRPSRHEQQLEHHRQVRQVVRGTHDEQFLGRPDAGTEDGLRTE